MENNFKDSPYREIFENSLRATIDRKHTNDLIMILFDQSVEQIVIEHNSELTERYNKSQEALEGVMSLRQLIEYPDNTEPDHIDEAMAVSKMISLVEQALNPTNH